MFDIGWLELLIIGIVALIVVGPKDLPGMFRTVGQFVGKARGMAREFQRSMEAAADESGLKDATDTLKGMDNIGLDQPAKAMKNYTKNFVSQRDQKAADAAAKAAEDAPADPAPEKPAATKPATKKPAAKKPAAKKPAATKTAAAGKPAAAKKPVRPKAAKTPKADSPATDS